MRVMTSLNFAVQIVMTIFYSLRFFIRSGFHENLTARKKIFASLRYLFACYFSIRLAN